MKLINEPSSPEDTPIDGGDGQHNNNDNDETEKPEDECTETEENKVHEVLFERLSETELMKMDLYILNKMIPNEYTSDMVSEEEVENLANAEIPAPSSLSPFFDQFLFSPRQITEDEIPLAIMTMVKDLDMMRRWCIERRALAKFILIVKLGYRDNPYHNWRHGFCVSHFAYLLLKNLDLVRLRALTHLEALAFFFSALCHDLDHRGTGNSFLRKTNSPFLSLYPTETSILEHHHYGQAVRILETDGCNILSNLTPSEYNEFLDIMKTVIMATDVANHFAILNDLQALAQDDNYSAADTDQHELVLCLLITASDLSDQTKDWSTAIGTAMAVYEEFFGQGDLEKAMGMVPMDMMDRNKAVVTDLQVSFVDKIAIPVFRIVSTLFPAALEPYRRLMINRKKWGRLQLLYITSCEDPEETPPDPTDLRAIINTLEYEGAERNF